MKAVLVCSGAMSDRSIINRYAADCSLLIGVDGGTSHILAAGIVPDIVFGDLDSIKFEDLRAVHQKNIEIRQFPPEKDFTDSSAALRYAVEKGFDQIIMLGAIGNRTDHMIANIMNLRSMAEAGISCTIIDESNVITAFTGSYHKDRSDIPFESTTVSLIALNDEVTGITTKGLKYQLVNAALKLSDPSHGVSNEITEDGFGIEISGKGVLLVIITRSGL